MRISLLLLASFLLTGGVPPATNPSCVASDDEQAATLTIHVIDLRNRKGTLLFQVFATEKGFPTDSRNAVCAHVRPADTDRVEFTCRLPPGQYAASVLHDENGNGQMDRNLFGIPREGYGVTNNPKPRFRAATFREALFNLPPEGASLTISLQYF
ncbi:MAG: DUF2141 domain-containing protein [Phycisphaerae bacterium]|nr:DUF2141 domain-containing protein [Phycisphaerae bacterium]MDW8261882.1 DUF2141 domain-containing protein [Phycisphaerales bacterium]